MWVYNIDTPTGAIHAHTYASGTITPSMYRREDILIQKTDSASATFPPQATVMGLASYLVPGIARALGYANRLLMASASNASNGTTANTKATTSSSTNDTHDHSYQNFIANCDLPLALYQSYGTPQTSGGAHTHTVTHSITYDIKRYRMAMFTGASDFNVGPGVIVFWPNALNTLPLDWVPCNGKLGTPDLRDYFLEVAASGAEGQKAGNNSIYMTAGTNIVYHNHGTPNQAQGLRQAVRTGHSENKGHSHSVSQVSGSYTPPYYALYLVMFNPSPAAAWIDNGLLITGGGANGATPIVDSSPSGLTATASGSPNYDTAQTQLGIASSVYNASGDRLSYTSFDWGVRFTLEGRFRVTTATAGVLFGNRTAGTGTEDFSVQYNPATGIEFVVDDVVQYTAGNPGVGVWFYVTVCYSGTGWYFYYGLVSTGVATRTGIMADVVTAHDTDFYIGNNNTTTAPFLGHYVQIRHLRNICLYTGSAIAIPLLAYPTS
jgi:hypothetical protein